MLIIMSTAGTRLLTTGEVLQMWQWAESKESQKEPKEVEFFFDDVERSAEQPPSYREWSCVWHCKPANPVTLAKFSSDGLLFATAGKVSQFFGLTVSQKILVKHCQLVLHVVIIVFCPIRIQLVMCA